MKPVLLCIMDGIALRDEKENNAFLTANTPNLDYLMKEYPNSKLKASGREVGIPDGQMGNSEIGHMNIGAGRKVLQPLEYINTEIENGSFFDNVEMKKLFDHVKKNNSRLQLIGLVSDGGIHSHINHLFAILEYCKKEDITDVYIHVVTDGRDTVKDVCLSYLNSLQNKLDDLGFGEIASVSGRYYTMDRDTNYDRLKRGYDVIVSGEGKKFDSYNDIVSNSYAMDKYDEFLEPGLILEDGLVEDNDGVLLFNFRSDRLKEIGGALSNIDNEVFEVKEFSNLMIKTLFKVDEIVDSKPLFETDDMVNDWGEYLDKLGLSQLRIAETEKYVHVTHFFDGDEDEDYSKEKKILIPSPKVATYDLKPEMSAYEITDELFKVIEDYDFIILNYANGDMVGHTGNFEAAVKAVEVVDDCVGKLYKKTQEIGGLLVITADHGNCDDMGGKWLKTHTLNDVPFIICKKGFSLKDGKLGDIAPTLFSLVGISVPKEMTGNVLFEGNYETEG